MGEKVVRKKHYDCRGLSLSKDVVKPQENLWDVWKAILNNDVNRGTKTKCLPYVIYCWITWDRGSAPAKINSWQILIWPNFAAWWSGVMPTASRISTLIHLSISSVESQRMAFKSPWAAAWWRRLRSPSFGINAFSPDFVWWTSHRMQSSFPF